MMMEWRETKAGQPRGGYSRRKMAGEIVRRPRKTVGDLVHGEFSYIPYFPDYKSHLNISRTPLFLPKIWVKFIDKSHPLLLLSLHVGTSSVAYT